MPERPAKDKSTKPRLSRLAQLRADRKDEDYMPDLPPIEGGAFLLDYLWQLGPTMAAGMGAGPITQTEMRAWQINMGIDLEPWEARFLRGLSCDYLDQWQKAQKPDCAPPWQAVATAVDKAAVANRMRNAIRQMAGS